MGFRVRLVFGSFDQLSPNDLALLEKARSNCDRLVIAVQSDIAVTASGAKTPVQDQATRAYVLASTVFSDAVVVCRDETLEAAVSNIDSSAVRSWD
jgi:D-beta-D-heptose 7-phosphate kinase/D-beta-D-heptose 1-phosphate adenosyltransferase